VRLFVSYTGATALENVMFATSCALPVFLTTDMVVLPSLAGGNRTPTIVPLTFRTRSAELPVSLLATVVATHAAATGEPRCARCDLTLPLFMVAAPAPPQKQSRFKLTFDINRAPPQLGQIFEDILSKKACTALHPHRMSCACVAKR